DRRRFAEAVAQFSDALNTMEAISTADPSNTSYRQSVAESLAWLADAERAIGNYDRAIELRTRNVALYNQLFSQSRAVRFQERLVPALRALGNLRAERGQFELAGEQLRASIAEADLLTTVEPNNTLWLEYGYRARISLAKLLL